MEVSLKKVFSIVDGRLSTKIEDVYEMLEFIFSTKINTHEIPKYLELLESQMPLWYAEARLILMTVYSTVKDCDKENDFEYLMWFIDEYESDTIIKLEKLI